MMTSTPVRGLVLTRVLLNGNTLRAPLAYRWYAGGREREVASSVELPPVCLTVEG